MTAIEKLKEISAFLKSKGIEDAAKESEILITESLLKKQFQGLSFEFQDRKGIKSKICAGDLEIDDETLLLIDNFVERRSRGEPIQYIIGYVEFYGLKINVGSGVLIPRPETELLVEETIKILHSRITHYALRITILDLCTGSGCIAIVLAKHFPDADVYGIDISETAIKYAVQNAIENNIKNVHFIKGDLFHLKISPNPSFPKRGTIPLYQEGCRGVFPPLLKNSGTGTVPVFGVHYFDCIVSNPPYIKTSDIQGLQKEIKDYEPIKALNGGKDGLDFYRKILNMAGDYLSERGIIILEIGFGQANDVLLIANKAGFDKVDFIKDYSGIERICIINR